MKRALLIGVNRYKNPRIQGLNGCINDVLNMRSVLKEFFGFEDSSIHVLTDERAECSRIKDRLNDMLYRTHSDDLAVFHFSGHGAQIRDRSGDELSDGLDELICPYDMDWGDQTTFITDDVLSDIISEAQRSYYQSKTGPSMEVFLDCCHSGTGIRAVDDTHGLSRQQSRSILPPIDLLCRSMDTQNLPIERLFVANQNLSDPVLWSACTSEQAAADVLIPGAGYNGLFTWSLCQTLRSSKGIASRASVLSGIRASIHHNGFSQLPQLESRHPGKLTTGLFTHE